MNTQITRAPVNAHKAYHAHVYFDEETVDFASEFCRQAGDIFNLKVGTVHQRLVGPHPEWSCQITFAAKHFDDLIPWLDDNRNGLTILVHALTGDNLKDHTDYAYWLGAPATLNIAMFEKD